MVNICKVAIDRLLSWSTKHSGVKSIIKSLMVSKRFDGIKSIIKSLMKSNTCVKNLLMCENLLQHLLQPYKLLGNKA